MRLRYPEVAYRSCKVCLVYGFDEYGRMEYDRMGNPELRIIANRPPCCDRDGKYLPVEETDENGRKQEHSGCPKGNPDQSIELIPIAARWYGEYLECKAMGHFPDDAFVGRIAKLVRGCEDSFEHYRQNEFRSALTQLAIRSHS